MELIASSPYYKMQIDMAVNRFYLDLLGIWTSERHVPDWYDDFTKSVTALSNGFSALVDLSGMTGTAIRKVWPARRSCWSRAWTTSTSIWRAATGPRSRCSMLVRSTPTRSSTISGSSPPSPRSAASWRCCHEGARDYSATTADREDDDDAGEREHRLLRGPSTG